MAHYRHEIEEIRRMPLFAHHVETPQILIMVALLAAGGWLGWWLTSLLMERTGHGTRSGQSKV
jgi:hypothetical protein